jgi:hypothetical protein
MGWAIDGQLYGSYNHFDSYPTGLGQQMGEAIGVMRAEGFDKYRELARKMQKITNEDEPSPEERVKYAHLWQNVSTGTDWYSLLRENQGELIETLQTGIYIDGTEFPTDGLWCEWAYVADFDREVLEVYEGGLRHKPTKGRWAGRDAGKDEKKSAKEQKRKPYYPAELIAEIPFAEAGRFDWPALEAAAAARADDAA